jgi:hypothetical protein
MRRIEPMTSSMPFFKRSRNLLILKASIAPEGPQKRPKPRLLLPCCSSKPVIAPTHKPFIFSKTEAAIPGLADRRCPWFGSLFREKKATLMVQMLPQKGHQKAPKTPLEPLIAPLLRPSAPYCSRALSRFFSSKILLTYPVL